MLPKLRLFGGNGAKVVVYLLISRAFIRLIRYISSRFNDLENGLHELI